MTTTSINKLSDEDLVKLILKDKNLYQHLIARYQKKLFRYANYLVADYHQATDIVQEALIKAYINLNSFNPNKKFSAWIYRIVHNQAINIAKKYHKEVSMPEGIDFKSQENLEDEYIKKELKTKINLCLDQLPIIYKEPLMLYFIEERSYQDISDILRIPIGTVSTRISRAKIIFKKICQQNQI